MRKGSAILTVLFLSLVCSAQEKTILSNTEQQLEILADAEQSETEDDYFLQQLSYFRKNPANLNTVTAETLKELRILSDLQIAGFIMYRNVFGKFLSVYELQAIPNWDIHTIRKILPFVTVGEPFNISEYFPARLKNGEHTLLVRYSQVLEKARGYNRNSSGTKYLGGRERLFFRYRYQYKNILQYGIVGDKDAGEQFFKGAQPQGFDFYSYHFFARDIGAIKALAIGDYTVNLGQGLIHWQSLAFGKSPEVMGIKRQSPVLRPYNAAGEFNFHRGVAFTIGKRSLETTMFASIRNLSANYVRDTINNLEFVSSVSGSGYHRTASEVADRKLLRQTSLGGNVSFKKSNVHIGVNAVLYHYSLPIQKKDEPYNLYSVKGKIWNNFSVDYSYTFRNVHFFGEAASCRNFSKAFINGVLVSVDPKVDLSFLYRNISQAYQAIHGNAFTENTHPSNESGIYAGISFRPGAGWRIDGYADFFRFPWLRHLADAPSQGSDYFIQVTCSPNKTVEIYSRFRNETKQKNQPDNTTSTNQLSFYPKQSWRIQSSFTIGKILTLRSRTELLWYDNKGENSEKGFLAFFDLLYSPAAKPWSANIRIQYFETEGYNSRIYAYENDVLYYFSIPAFFDGGLRYYLNLNYDYSAKVSIWVKWMQTVYADKGSFGSGMDEIPGNKRSEIRWQMRIIF